MTIFINCRIFNSPSKNFELSQNSKIYTLGTESEIDELELDDIDLDVFDSESEDEGLTMTPSTSSSQSRSQSSGESVNASSPVMPKGTCFLVLLLENSVL